MKNKHLTILAFIIILILSLTGLNFKSNDKNNENEICKLIGFAVIESEKFDYSLIEKSDKNISSLIGNAICLNTEKNEEGFVQKLKFPFDYVAYFGIDEKTTQDNNDKPSVSSSNFSDGYGIFENVEINHSDKNNKLEISFSADLIFYQKAGLEKVYNLSKIYKVGEQYFLIEGDNWVENTGLTSLSFSNKETYKNQYGKDINELSHYSATSKVGNFSNNITFIEYNKDMKEINRKEISLSEINSYKVKNNTEFLLLGQNNEKDFDSNNLNYKFISRNSDNNSFFTAFQDDKSDFYKSKKIEII